MDEKQHTWLRNGMMALSVLRAVGVIAVVICSFLAIAGVLPSSEAAYYGMMGAYGVVTSFVFGYFLSNTKKSRDTIYDCSMLIIDNKVSEGKSLLSICDEDEINHEKDKACRAMIVMLTAALAIASPSLIALTVPLAIFIFGKLQTDLYQNALLEALNDIANAVILKYKDGEYDEQD